MRISDWSSDVCSSDLYHATVVVTKLMHQLADFAAILEAEAAQYPSRKFRIQRERDKFRPPPFNVKLGEDAVQSFSDRNYAKSLRILRGGYIPLNPVIFSIGGRSDAHTTELQFIILQS